MPKLTAYQVIKKYGWVQGTSGDDRNGYCLSAAVCKAYSIATEQENALQKLSKVIPGESIVSWNDALGRTKADVLAMLKKAKV